MAAMQNLIAKLEPTQVRLKVLLIEDQRGMRELIVRSLKKVGITDVVEATSADQALGKLLLSGPGGVNVILTDTTLPGLSCANFLKRLRMIATPWARSVPVVVLSSDTTTESYASLRPFNITSYLIKPVSGELLKTTLERAVCERARAAAVQAEEAAAGIVDGVPTLFGTAIAGIVAIFQSFTEGRAAAASTPRPAARSVLA